MTVLMCQCANVTKAKQMPEQKCATALLRDTAGQVTVLMCHYSNVTQARKVTVLMCQCANETHGWPSDYAHVSLL